MKSIRICISVVTLVLSVAASSMAQSPSVPPPAPVQPASAPDPGWEVEIAPIYLWAPISINSVTATRVPRVAFTSGRRSRPSAETGASLNGAAMAAFRVEKNWWLLRGNFVWAGLSGEGNGRMRGCRAMSFWANCSTGVEVVKHLYVEGGVRRLALDIEAKVLEYPEGEPEAGRLGSDRRDDVPGPAGEPLAADAPR